MAKTTCEQCETRDAQFHSFVFQKYLCKICNKALQGGYEDTLPGQYAHMSEKQFEKVMDEFYEKLSVFRQAVDISHHAIYERLEVIYDRLERLENPKAYQQITHKED